jgi:hypothetical protein
MEGKETQSMPPAHNVAGFIEQSGKKHGNKAVIARKHAKKQLGLIPVAKYENDLLNPKQGDAKDAFLF